MAIAVRGTGSTTWDVNASSQVVTKPAGVVTGDLMVMVIGANMSSPVALPTGWTSVGTATLTGACLTVGYRLAQAGDTTWTVTPGGGAQQFGGVLQTFSGVDSTTPIDATGSAATTASASSLAAPAVTVVTANAWELIGFASTSTGNPTATGFTVLKDAQTNEAAALLYNTTPKSTGSTGTVTVSFGSGGTALLPFAIRPAAAATPSFDWLQPPPPPRFDPLRVVAY